jgi:formylglycine-generating enzyme required for sulfatase activity
LPTNQEWQAAALGTPDPGTADDGATTCATDSFLSATGSRGGCVSDVGAFDMVGNLQEYVAEWVPRSPAQCSLVPNNNWSAFSDDLACLVGAAMSGPPGAIVRGGSFISGARAGVFAVVAGAGPEEPAGTWGFRCAR